MTTPIPNIICNNPNLKICCEANYAIDQINLAATADSNLLSKAQGDMANLQNNLAQYATYSDVFFAVNSLTMQVIVRLLVWILLGADLLKMRRLLIWLI